MFRTSARGSTSRLHVPAGDAPVPIGNSATPAGSETSQNFRDRGGEASISGLTSEGGTTRP